jgi:hypothetical protein
MTISQQQQQQKLFVSEIRSRISPFKTSIGCGRRHLPVKDDLNFKILILKKRKYLS